MNQGDQPLKKRKIEMSSSAAAATGMSSSAAAATEMSSSDAALEVNKLNELLNEIIQGQEDITIPADQDSSNRLLLAGTLFDKLDEIIAKKETQLKDRQDRLADVENETMGQQEAEQMLQEDNDMINKINEALANSRGRLNRGQRILLNNRIIQLISDSITQFEVNEELSLDTDGVRNNLKGLFNGLIEYYTEMAVYGYELAPEIFAKIGSIVAGSVIIGGTIYAPNISSQGQGDLLVWLSRYLQTIITTASGLYFLQKGGVPVQGLLENLGGQARYCLERGCRQLSGNLKYIWDAGIDKLSNYLTSDYSNIILSQDSASQASLSQYSASQASTISTVESVKTAIEPILAILDIPKDEQIDMLLNNPQSTMPDLNSQLTAATAFDDIDGGRSRRHMKMRRTRRGRGRGKGRRGRGRVTKKGRRRHKTMKRHRR